MYERFRFISEELLDEHLNAKHRKTCNVCSESFPDKPTLNEHRSRLHPDAALTCDKCEYSCTATTAMRKHMRRHRDDERGGYQCDECGHRFTSKGALYHHGRGVHSGQKPYKCRLCSEAFGFAQSLRLHTLRHAGERPFRCTVCSKTYLTSSHLKYHVAAVHGAVKQFVCHVCNKAFSYENSLRLHSMLHTGERPFTCASCGKSFVSRSGLRAHEDSHVNGGRHECDICHKSYKTIGLMRAHKRRHTADGSRFICDVCGATFMYRSNLDAHCAVHSDARAHSCASCNKTFKTYATLYSHQQSHKHTEPFVCATCGKSFKTKERMKAHARRHTGLKPFRCNLCNGMFPDKGGLSKHRKTVHASTPRFACPVCHKMCNRADNLRVHMKVHNDADLLKLPVEHLMLSSRGGLTQTKDASDCDVRAAHTDPALVLQSEVDVAVTTAVKKLSDRSRSIHDMPIQSSQIYSGVNLPVTSSDYMQSASDDHQELIAGASFSQNYFAGGDADSIGSYILHRMPSMSDSAVASTVALMPSDVNLTTVSFLQEPMHLQQMAAENLSFIQRR